jgi:hypothetical protein
MRYSLALTGGVHHVTGGGPIGFLGLFKRFITAIKSLTGVTGGFGTLNRVKGFWELRVQGVLRSWEP